MCAPRVTDTYEVKKDATSYRRGGEGGGETRADLAEADILVLWLRSCAEPPHRSSSVVAACGFQISGLVLVFSEQLLVVSASCLWPSLCGLRIFQSSAEYQINYC
jgi:hypothetical protein